MHRYFQDWDFWTHFSHLVQQTAKAGPLCSLKLPCNHSTRSSKATRRLGTCPANTAYFYLTVADNKCLKKKRKKKTNKHVLQEETTFVQNSCSSSHIEALTLVTRCIWHCTPTKKKTTQQQRQPNEIKQNWDHLRNYFMYIRVYILSKYTYFF